MLTRQLFGKIIFLFIVTEWTLFSKLKGALISYSHKEELHTFYPDYESVTMNCSHHLLVKNNLYAQDKLEHVKYFKEEFYHVMQWSAQVVWLGPTVSNIHYE